MDYIAEFKKEKEENIKKLVDDPNTSKLGLAFIHHCAKYNYSYYSEWMGRPIIQLPQDLMALQEIVMSVQPDLIIETGIAHGGSLVFSASMLTLLDVYAPQENGYKREVIGVDIEIREHNRIAIENHPMFSRITMFEGSSTDPAIFEKVREIASRHKVILVMLDSSHSHAHVLNELRLYSSLVSVESYLVVFDTAIEFIGIDYANRPWGKGNNPYTAVQEFLKDNSNFLVDPQFENKNVLTSCPGGWLKRIR